MHFGRRCVCQPYSWLRALHILVLKLTTGCRENTSYAECSSRDQEICVSFVSLKSQESFERELGFSEHISCLLRSSQSYCLLFQHWLWWTFNPSCDKVSNWFWACVSPSREEQASSKIEINSSKFCSIRLCMCTEPVTKVLNISLRAPSQMNCTLVSLATAKSVTRASH